MKILSRFKKFTKKRQQQLQRKKEPAVKEITEHSSQESLQSFDATNVDVINTEKASSKSQKRSNSEFCKNFKEPEARDIPEHSFQEESLQCSEDTSLDVTINMDRFCKDFKELIEGYENMRVNLLI